MLIESGSYDGKLRGQLESAEAAGAFIRAGKGIFTLESTTTGARFTYKISTPKDNKKVLFVKVLTGPDNSNSYTYLGVVRGDSYAHGKKSSISQTAGSVLALRWALERIFAGELPKTLRVWHEGRCGACARRLTVPASVATGFGPECSSRLGIEWAVPVCEAA